MVGCPPPIQPVIVPSYTVRRGLCISCQLFLKTPLAITTEVYRGVSMKTSIEYAVKCIQKEVCLA